MTQQTSTMICPNCRNVVPADVDYCPHCGYNLRPHMHAGEQPPAPPTPPPQQPVPQPPYAEAPPPYYPPGTYPTPGAPPAAPAVRRTARPTAGGALILLAGVLELLYGGLIAAAGAAATPTSDVVLITIGIVILIFGLVAIAGGASAIRRRSWGLAIAGGVLALLAVGPLFLGSIFGIIGLILVGISRDEFVRRP